MIKSSKVLGILKKNFYLFIVIVLFIILCVSYILIIPAFEAPDEPWHFSYAFYLSKYNNMPSQYNEQVSIEQYIKENIEENSLNVFYADNKYMIYKDRAGELYFLNKFHDPPLYYFISSQIIKSFGVKNIYIEDNFNQEYGIYNRFIDNKILNNNSPTISLVLILRLFQIVYGVLIIFFIYKIIKLLSDDEFKNNSILLISGIAFLPQFVFLCSYINNDVLSALFGLISVYFVLLLFKREKTYLGLIAILFAFIGGFTKYTMLIMLPVTIIALLIWFIIKKKKRALISILIIIFLTITVFYYVINFERASYKQTKIEAGWEEGHEYENVETENNVLVKDYALNFNGTGNEVSVSSTPSLATKELTVESWVYIRSFNNGFNYQSTPIISSWNFSVPGNQKGYYLGATCINNRIMTWQFIVCDGVNPIELDFEYLSYDDFVDKYSNRWLHISGVFMGEKYMKLYINGQLEATKEAGISEQMNPETNTPTYFGSFFSAYYLNGMIDEVRIWNTARTQMQIQSNMYKQLKGNEKRLVGYWNFNKGWGSTVYDSSVNKNHGTIFNIRKNPSLLLERIISTSNGILTGFRDSKDSFYINVPALTQTFKSTVAFFGWLNIAADNFIYYFFLAYVISGILMFFANIKDYGKSKKSIIFIILSIITIFTYFLLYAASTNWAQRQGRIILLAVFLTYILAILGFKSIKVSYRNILYYGLFASSLFISVFCLYNYIYLKYY